MSEFAGQLIKSKVAGDCVAKLSDKFCSGKSMPQIYYIKLLLLHYGFRSSDSS